MSASVHDALGPAHSLSRRTAPLPAIDANRESLPQPGRFRAVGALAAGITTGCLMFVLGPGRPAPPPPLSLSLGYTRLEIPRALLRPGATLPGGAPARVDLALQWPGLGPVRHAVPDTGRTLRLGGAILVTLSPADPSSDPPSRLASVYARFLEPLVQSGPGGLMQRRFKPATPYENEEILFSPPDGRLFLARCDTGARPGDVLQPLCLTEFRHGGLDVQVRFEPKLTESWDALRAGVLSSVDRLVLP